MRFLLFPTRSQQVSNRTGFIGPSRERFSVVEGSLGHAPPAPRDLLVDPHKPFTWEALQDRPSGSPVDGAGTACSRRRERRGGPECRETSCRCSRTVRSCPGWTWEHERLGGSLGLPAVYVFPSLPVICRGSASGASNDARGMSRRTVASLAPTMGAMALVLMPMSAQVSYLCCPHAPCHQKRGNRCCRTRRHRCADRPAVASLREDVSSRRHSRVRSV